MFSCNVAIKTRDYQDNAKIITFVKIYFTKVMKKLADLELNLLDKTLEHFKDSIEQGGLTDTDVKNFGLKENLHQYSLDSIIEKLERDKMIFRNLRDMKYQITSEGIIFEGYVIKRKRESILVTHQLVQTWAIAVGTGLAGIYALFELVKMVLKYCGC